MEVVKHSSLLRDMVTITAVKFFIVQAHGHFCTDVISSTNCLIREQLTFCKRQTFICGCVKDMSQGILKGEVSLYH